MTQADHQGASAQHVGEMPVRLGTPAEFDRVRRFFHDAQFNDDAVCAALKIHDISGVGAAERDNVDAASLSPSLRAALDLFVFESAVSADDFRATCGEETFAAFAALNLIRAAQQGEAAIVCPVWLYPVDGFITASDRRTNPDGGSHGAPKEMVFPAHDSGRLLPAAHGGDALDLCGGSGIGAMHLSRTAKLAVTADVTERSAFFANFNARLNGVNVESVHGDLYAPVSGRHFDLIAAHPPWVPSTGDAMVFRDGGDSGEAIMQRVVEGIPRHLLNGGTGVVVSMGRDIIDASFERRARGWLGKSGADCDIILGIERVLTIEDMVKSMRRLHLKDNAEEADRMADRFRTLGTVKFVYGALFIRRTGQPVIEPPLRLLMSSAATASDFDRLFAWRMRRRSPDFPDWLSSTKPRMAPYLEINVRHVVKNGVLTPGSAALIAEAAFSTGLRLDPWTIPLISSFDGNRTVEHVFNEAHRGEKMPGDFTLPPFIDLIAMMIEQGFLEIDIPIQRPN